jgi:hypothetical protein
LSSRQPKRSRSGPVPTIAAGARQQPAAAAQADFGAVEAKAIFAQ